MFIVLSLSDSKCLSSFSSFQVEETVKLRAYRKIFVRKIEKKNNKQIEPNNSCERQVQNEITCVTTQFLSEYNFHKIAMYIPMCK